MRVKCPQLAWRSNGLGTWGASISVDGIGFYSLKAGWADAGKYQWSITTNNYQVTSGLTSDLKSAFDAAEKALDSLLTYALQHLLSMVEQPEDAPAPVVRRVLTPEEAS